MQPRRKIHDELEQHGLCVVRRACDTEICGKVREEALEGVKTIESLPKTMAERNRGNTHRWFLPVDIADSKKEEKGYLTRTNFRLPMTPNLRHLTSRAIEKVVDDSNWKLTEILFIVSEKGAAAQSFHSDADYIEGAPRTITLFLALQDIEEECMGPTQFILDTHSPKCFAPTFKWLPPLPKNGLKDKKVKWFPLKIGDGILMESTSWHRGGQNLSNKKRVLLSLSFLEVVKEEEEDEHHDVAPSSS